MATPVCLARVFSTSSDLFLPYFCASISSVLPVNLSISFNFISNNRIFYQSKHLQLMDPVSTTVISSFNPILTRSPTSVVLSLSPLQPAHDCLIQLCSTRLLITFYFQFLISSSAPIVAQLVYSTPLNAVAFILLSVFFSSSVPIVDQPCSTQMSSS